MDVARTFISVALAGLASSPFVATASHGPSAGARITATVTRSVGGANVTLPAALVPELEPGDVVDVGFPGYRRPPSTVNYHVDVGFITESAPQHWLFPRSGPVDRLFDDRQRGAHPPPSGGRIHFVYGQAPAIGIPIFTIVPEDAKTRGLDGVRDYVDAHPTDFVDMADSTNTAVDQYGYADDFLTALAGGAIDPATARARIEGAAQSLGVSPATVDACYTSGGSSADIRNCIQSAFDGVMLQPNISAPTQAQFLGGVAGAAEPLALAPYVSSLLTVWKLFVHTGHLEYEYLPTTIALADAGGTRRDELLMGLKVPTIRPPGAYSDVLFFTIGDPTAAERAPAVVNDAAVSGACERDERFSVPLHLDHTSRYVHDTALVVTPDGRAPYEIALDPRSLDAPIVDRSRFAGSADGAYEVSLRGSFGFDPIAQPVRVAMRLALPNDAPWQLAPMPDHRPVAGEALDVIARSPGAACLSRAELQIGSRPPLPLAVTPLDDERVELKASLAGLPAGPAQIRFVEDDPGARRFREASASIAIEAPPPAVDPAPAVMALGDGFVRLTGSGFERVRAVQIGGADYVKTAGASAGAACFDGPPLAPPLTPGQRLTAQLETDDGSPWDVFPVTVAAPRPVLTGVHVVAGDAPVQLSTDPVTVVLDVGAPLPRQFGVRLRNAAVEPATPCDALEPDPTALTLPEAAAQVRSPHDVAVRFRADVLHERAFGTLEVQLVDGASGLASPWVSVPATFARAPEVTQVVCPADTASPCRLYGSDLLTIAAVADASGTFIAPGLDCPPSDKGVACVFVPPAPHVTVRLVDAGATETLPDALITRTK